MTRIVGLIGGMSWQTTAVYYEAINKHVCSKMGGIHSANLLIRSMDYADIGRMVTSGDFDGMIEMLSDCGQELKSAGAQSLVLCANVAHKAADTLEKRSGLPVLHIVDFTGQEIVNRGFKKVGLLGTRAVMEEEFYKARLREKYGLEVVVPNKDFRDKVDGLIFGELSKQPVAEEVKTTFKDAYNGLLRDHQVDCVALACTELRLVFNSDEMDIPVFEPTALHAKGIAEWALQQS